MNMKKHVFKHVMMGLAAIVGFSAVTMLLWNWLIPGVFGLAAINFWQALGVLALTRILFGGFGHREMMRGMRNGNPIHDKWVKMTDEQRREFINRRREHMHRGHFFGGGFDFGNDSAKDND
jgi:hypothetical protein